MVTDMSERGLEALITNALTSNRWLPGDPQDYERAHCVDLNHLSAFLIATQPETAEALDLNADSTTRRRFLDRLKREISNRGIIDVVRKGVQHGPSEVTLFYGTPTPGNTQAEDRYRQNRFSVTSTTTTRLRWWLHPAFTAGGAASLVGAARPLVA